MSVGRDGRVVARKTTRMQFASDRGFSLPDIPVVDVDPSDVIISPERQLMVALLEDAVLVWTGSARSLDAQSPRMRERERAWIMSNDLVWPFSFVNVCHALDIDVDRLRSRLLELEPRLGERVPQARRHTVARATSDRIDVPSPRVGRRPGRERRTVTATRGFGGTAHA